MWVQNYANARPARRRSSLTKILTLAEIVQLYEDAAQIVVSSCNGRMKLSKSMKLHRQGLPKAPKGLVYMTVVRHVNC